jgi:hypothetical protein
MNPQTTDQANNKAAAVIGHALVFVGSGRNPDRQDTDSTHHQSRAAAFSFFRYKR